MRFRPQARFSILSAGNLGLGLLRMYRAKRRVCQMGVLETTVVFAKGWRSDKEARSEFPLRASQTYFSQLNAISVTFRPNTTQKLEMRAASMSDGGAGDSRELRVEQEE